MMRIIMCCYDCRVTDTLQFYRHFPGWRGNEVKGLEHSGGKLEFLLLADAKKDYTFIHRGEIYRVFHGDDTIMCVHTCVCVFVGRRRLATVSSTLSRGAHTIFKNVGARRSRSEFGPKRILCRLSRYWAITAVILYYITCTNPRVGLLAARTR